MFDYLDKEYKIEMHVVLDGVWAMQNDDYLELLVNFAVCCPPQHLLASVGSSSQHFTFQVELFSSKPPLPAWQNVTLSSSLPLYCLTLVSPQNNVTLALLRDIVNVIEKQHPHGKIVVIKHLSGDAPPPTTCLVGYTAIDFLFHKLCNNKEKKEDEEENLDDIRNELHRLSQLYKVDLFLQVESEFRHLKRLAVFDMDSTLIQQECLDEMARLAGVEEEVKHITLRAMNGELDFEQSLRTRVRLLKGQDETLIKWVIQRCTFTPGAEILCTVLKRLGVHLAVISGGFVPFVTHVQQKLALDYAFANSLEVSLSLSLLFVDYRKSIS